MNYWPHKHILTLANFSKENYKRVIDLAHRFKSENKADSKDFSSLRGFLVTSLLVVSSTINALLNIPYKLILLFSHVYFSICCRVCRGIQKHMFKP